MKKLFVLATAALVMTSVAFAHGDDKKKCAKGKECCKTEAKADKKECKKDDKKEGKACCKKDAKKDTKTAEVKDAAKETK